MKQKRIELSDPIWKRNKRKEFLDYHHKEKLGEDDKTQKNKKEIIQGIEKNVNRKHMFHCLTRHAGKGARYSLKRVHTVDDNDKIIKTHVKIEIIEDETIKYNVKYFTKSYDDIVHREKNTHKA